MHDKPTAVTAPTRPLRMVQEPLRTGISMSGAAEHHSAVIRFFARLLEYIRKQGSPIQALPTPDRKDLSYREVSGMHLVHELIGKVIGTVRGTFNDYCNRAAKEDFEVELTYIDEAYKRFTFKLVNVRNNTTGALEVEARRPVTNVKIANSENQPGTIGDLFRIAVYDKCNIVYTHLRA